MTASPASPAAPPVDLPRALVVVGLSILVGAVASAAAFGFTVLAHESERFVWQTVPGWWGAAEAPWWWVVVVLAVGGLAVAGAARLAGHGGHHPLDGLSFDIGPRALPSTLLAALASLAAGAVVGPEAPLLAIGTAVALAVARGPLQRAAAPLALAGAAAAIGVVLGNPMITGILILEGALLAARALPRQVAVVHLLLPVLAALGSGYLVKVGVGTWTGLSSHPLEITSLDPYPTVQLVDLGPAVVVAVLTAALVVGATRGAEWLRRRVPATAGLVLGGVAVAALALVARGLTGEPVSRVLFSGQTDLGDVVALSSIGVLLVVALAKALAYGVSLGVGFRGGTVFPAVFVGATLGTAMHVLVPATSVTALVAAGIAAGAAGAVSLPFTATLLGTLIVVQAGPAATVPAILGAVVGVLAATWLHLRVRVQSEADLEREL